MARSFWSQGKCALAILLGQAVEVGGRPQGTGLDHDWFHGLRPFEEEETVGTDEEAAGDQGLIKTTTQHYEWFSLLVLLPLGLLGRYLYRRFCRGGDGSGPPLGLKDIRIRFHPRVPDSEGRSGDHTSEVYFDCIEQ